MEEQRPIRVSIVEDEPMIRESLDALLRDAPDLVPFTVHATAEDALEKLGADGPDVVVMDINLPGLSGIECVRQLSQRCPATQFLMYTVQDDDQRVFEALKSGANGYLLKSAGPEEILQAVRELHAGGAPMSAHVARRVVAHLRPPAAAPDAENLLSSRENEVLHLLAQGLLYKEIADRTGITTGTVKQHIHRIYAKLHVQNRTEALNRFFGW